MPRIKHHISDQLLIGYAAGTLPEAFSLIVASHVSLCDECRAALAAHEAVGGALLEEAAGDVTADMDAGALARTLAMLEAPRAASDTAERGQRRAARGPLPAPLAEYVGTDLENVRWRPVGMGVKQAILSTSKSATARLLYIPAGTAVPDHSHHGTEITMVLQGAFEDETARFERGDVEIADGDLHHTPVADIHEDCICLAVTDAPLKFRGLLPRLLQPFLRI